MQLAFLGVGCLVATVASATGCSRESQQPTALVSPALVILQGARGVQHKTGVEEILSYELEDPCPAQNAIAAITRHVEQLGWRPRTEDVLNPGIPTSQVRGWNPYEDDVRNRYVWQWDGQWESPGDEVVWYDLKYTREGLNDTSCGGPLHVTAFVLLSDEVRQLRQRRQ